MKNRRYRVYSLWLRLIIWLIALHGLTGGLNALDPAIPLERYILHHWEVQDGLPANYIISLAQSEDGYLWVATRKGLHRLIFTKPDIGQEQPVISSILENHVILRLLEDRENNIWAGSDAGLWRIKEPRLHPLSLQQAIGGKPVMSMNQDAGGGILVRSAG